MVAEIRGPFSFARDRSLGIEVVCQRRKAGKRSDAKTLLVTDNQRVASRGVEKTGVSKARAEEAEARFRASTEYREGSTNYPDRIYRAVREKPLLLLHLLSIGEKDTDLSTQQPIVAWSISFPRSSLEEKTVEYVVNTTWLRENFRDDLDEEEMAGDND